MAQEELLEEAKNGARRADVMGPSGWIKKKEIINKRFLNSTIRSTILSNRHKELSRSNRVNSTKNDSKEHETKIKKWKFCVNIVNILWFEE